MIRCIIIDTEKGTSEGVVYTFPTEVEYKVFFDCVKEVSSLCGRKMQSYTKAAYGKLPEAGNQLIKQYLMDVDYDEVDKKSEASKVNRS